MDRETYCVLSITLSLDTIHQRGRKQQPELHLECLILGQTEGRRTFSNIQHLVFMVLLASQLQFSFFNTLQIPANSRQLAKLYGCQPLCQRNILLRCGQKSHKGQR